MAVTAGSGPLLCGALASPDLIESMWRSPEGVLFLAPFYR